MNNRILYVTSFNEEIYQATGKNLVDSFFKHKIETDIFVGYEGFDITKLNKWDLIYYNLDIDTYLQDIQQRFKHYIPEYLGGLSKSCRCKDPWNRRDQRHVKRCHFNWWNRNWIRWFRKLACFHQHLRYTNSNGDYNYFIWIDSDCVFKRTLPVSFIDKLMENHSVAYMRGKVR